MKRLSFIFLAGLLIGCGGGGGGGGNPTPSSPPSVTTLPANSVTKTDAICNGSVNPNGVSTNAYFEWGTDPAFNNFTTTSIQAIGSGISPITVSSKINGLLSGTTYYYRVVGVNNLGTAKGTIVSCTAGSLAPTVSTNQETIISSSSVMLNGSVNPMNLLTYAYFEWGTDSSLSVFSATQDQQVGSDSSYININYTISNLATNKPYYFRIVASNSLGTVRGGIRSFTTPNIPIVQTIPTSYIGIYSATLSGEVNPNGTVTSIWFEWGTDASLNTYSTTKALSIGSGAVLQTINDSIFQLTPDVNYYYRIVASYASSLVKGNVLALHTNLSSPTSTWSKSYGTATIDEFLRSIDVYPAGGYIISGYENNLTQNILALKISNNGAIEWQKSYDSGFTDISGSVISTNDGGFVVGSYTNYPNINSGWKILITKLNANGIILWSKTYVENTLSQESGGGTKIIQTSDNGYLVGALHGVDRHIQLLKLDKDGSILWQNIYQGGSNTNIGSILKTDDGGYVIGCSYGSDVTIGAGDWDFWVIKINTAGTIDWQKVYGDLLSNVVVGLEKTSDGGYVVLGKNQTYSFTVLKLSSLGNILWGKTFTGGSNTNATSIKTTSDGGYIISGYTTDYGHGGTDIFVIKIDSNGNSVWQKIYGGLEQDVALKILENNDGTFSVVGYTRSFGEGLNDGLVLKINNDGTLIPNDMNINMGISDSLFATTNTNISPINTQLLENNIDLIATNLNITINQQTP